MRKINVLTFLTLDGVMQAPGGPEEDPSENFPYGGWLAPYFDEFVGKIMQEQISRPFDLLLGRKTFEIFATYWPQAEGGKTPSMKQPSMSFPIRLPPMNGKSRSF